MRLDGDDVETTGRFRRPHWASKYLVPLAIALPPALLAYTESTRRSSVESSTVKDKSEAGYQITKDVIEQLQSNVASLKDKVIDLETELAESNKRQARAKVLQTIAAKKKQAQADSTAAAAAAATAKTNLSENKISVPEIKLPNDLDHALSKVKEVTPAQPSAPSPTPAPK